MLWNFDELKGFRLHATDGDLGHVHDVLFEDDSWHVRYLVVDTGWIFGRRVLIGPQALGEPDGSTRTIPVRLTQEQVKQSPSIDTDKPVGRQQEDAIYRYYGWTPYWTAGGAVGLPGDPMLDVVGGAVDPASLGQPEGDPHLRSAREVSGYTVQAGRRDIGRASTLLLDTAVWQVRWLVADVGSAMTSRLVLVAPEWVRGLDWPEARIHVAADADKIANAPAYDPTRSLGREQERAVYEWHGQRPYW